MNNEEKIMKKKKSRKKAENIQLNSFEELIVLWLGPALSTLGDGVRLASSLGKVISGGGDNSFEG